MAALSIGDIYGIYVASNMPKSKISSFIISDIIGLNHTALIRIPPMELLTVAGLKHLAVALIRKVC